MTTVPDNHSGFAPTPVEAGVTHPVRIFSTCPASSRDRERDHARRAREVARWSERHGLRGMYIPGERRLGESWRLAELIGRHTRGLVPLVTVHPTGMHPGTLASMIAAFARSHARSMYIHWMANDPCGRGMRQAPQHLLVEYAMLVRQLTDGGRVPQAGAYPGVRDVTVPPEVPPALRPEYLVSGFSPHGASPARALRARPLINARALTDQQPGRDGGRVANPAALRLGIIARSERDTAWRTALRRFPPGRGGLARSVTRKVSDSHWRLRLYRLAEERIESGDPYWPGPLGRPEVTCPYLVGSHEDVGAALAGYVERGFDTFILGEPESEGDLEHARHAFESATAQVVAA